MTTQNNTAAATLPAVPDTSVQDTVVADLIEIIQREGAQIGKSMQQIRETVQKWIVACSVLEREEAALVIVEILAVSESWHGLNVNNLVSTIKDSVTGLVIKKTDAGKFAAIPKGKAKDYKFVVVRNWWEKSTPTDKEDPAARLLAEKLCTKLAKDGTDRKTLESLFNKALVGKVLDKMDQS